MGGVAAASVNLPVGHGRPLSFVGACVDEGQGEYEKWAARPKSGLRRGSECRVTDLMDRAPELLNELPGWFLSLTEGELAAVWVAAVVERVIERDIRPGDMARALVVVADRLHGMKVEIRTGEPVMLTTNKATPINKTPAPAPVARPAALPDGVVGSGVVGGGKYQVNVGAPPVAKPRRSKRNDAMAQAELLPVGAWFEWTDAARTCNCTTASKKWSAALGKKIAVYRSAGGKVIVKREG